MRVHPAELVAMVLVLALSPGERLSGHAAAEPPNGRRTIFNDEAQVLGEAPAANTSAFVKA